MFCSHKYEILESFIKEYESENWFTEAWEEYRQHVLNTSMDDVKMPSYIFKKYIEEKEVKE